MSDSKYTISIETKADGSGVEQTEAGLKHIGPVLEGLQEKFEEFGKTFAAGFQLELGAKFAESIREIPQQLAEAAHKAEEFVVKIRNIGLETNLSAEALQILGAAMERNGHAL